LELDWLKFGRFTSRFLRIIGISIDWVSVVICRDFRAQESPRPIVICYRVIALRDVVRVKIYPVLRMCLSDGLPTV